MTSLSEGHIKQLLAAFLEDASESLDRLEAALLQLEEERENAGLINEAFRITHTIKGDSGFLDLRKLESVAHLMEEVFSKARAGTLFLTRATTTALLKATDSMREMLAEVLAESAGEAAQPVPLEAVTRKLSALLATSGHDVTPIERAAGVSRFPQGAQESNQAATSQSASSSADAQSSSAASGKETRIIPSGKGSTWGFFDEEDEAQAPDHLIAPEDHAKPADTASRQQPDASQAIDSTAAATLASTSDNPASEAAPTASSQTQPPAEAPTTPAQKARQAQAIFSQRVRSTPSVRMDLERLEELVDLVGQLVIQRNQLLAHTNTLEDSKLSQLMLKSDRITSDLQRAVLRTRLQPASTLFEKFPRVIRDYNAESGKHVHLEVEGADTELDRSLVEGLRDPLVHLVRNACGHGIELPADRLAENKPAIGTLKLYARHEESRVVIGIEDDGAGIDPDRVRSIAVERGVISASDAERMSEQEIHQLIFTPGFSTTSDVSSMSGRGVGMDVVANSISKLGGSVRLRSKIGKGTRIELVLPLTLAIFPSLMVCVGGQRFALPQACVREAICLAKLNQPVEHVSSKPMLRYRDKLLPLLKLSDLLQVESQQKQDAQSEDADCLLIHSGDEEYLLAVDRLGEVQEVVIKPLHGEVAALPQYLGATLDADGLACMILDPQGLAEGRQDSLSSVERAARANLDAEAAATAFQSMVVFRLGEDDRCALPVDFLARIEDIPRDQIELIAGQHYTQYRGRALPLAAPAKHLGLFPARNPDLDEPQKVLLLDVDGRYAGIMVEAVLDIADVPLRATNLTSHQRGVRGSAVINGRTTLVLDAFALLTWDTPDLLAPSKDDRLQDQRRGRVLLVDTSPFYALHIESYLQSAGFVVYRHNEARYGLHAARMGEFDLLVADLGEHEMSNVEFIKLIREMPGRDKMPALALTKESDPQAIHALMAAGFTRHLTKLDYRELLATLDELIGGRRASESPEASE